MHLRQLRPKRSVPTAQNVKAQGNALGTCETNDQSPKGAKCSCIPITPFQGFDVRYWRFLGRCPRLSHCAALRQTAPATYSFNRVGNAPRVGIQPAGHCSRGPLGTRLNEPMPTTCCMPKSLPTVTALLNWPRRRQVWPRLLQQICPHHLPLA